MKFSNVISSQLLCLRHSPMGNKKKSNSDRNNFQWKGYSTSVSISCTQLRNYRTRLLCLPHTKTRLPWWPFFLCFSFVYGFLIDPLLCAHTLSWNSLWKITRKILSRLSKKGIKESLAGRLRVSISLELNVAIHRFPPLERHKKKFSSILIRFGDVVKWTCVLWPILWNKKKKYLEIYIHLVWWVWCIGDPFQRK